ncbi:hypothetical protein D0Z00_000841 [Geotrichum galactomycetum]|uniref:Uncharacterized protein n=1 Tax=Geotrichum galactomycetum TaxID=27317 RepID=A0ACB6V8U7_9ASCO|nr:hypothetical protein D0Z00_000841 [Geotrichum candidum]
MAATSASPAALQLQPPIIELSSSRLLFHQKHGNIIFLLPCSSTTPALLPFEFVARLVDVLEAYLTAPLIPTKIEMNYDTVSLILSEMLDGGAPYQTEPDMVREYVQPAGAIAKFLSSTPNWQSSPSGSAPGGSGGLLSGASSLNSIDLDADQTPWRRSNVRYTKNELFVDIVETINLIVPPARRAGAQYAGSVSSSSAFYTNHQPQPAARGKPLVARVDGRIFINSHLSGVPDINLVLATGKRVLEYPTFHPCVRTEESDVGKSGSATSSYSFIPPDGKFLLGSYSVEGVEPNLVQAELRTGLGATKSEFEVRVWTAMSRETENVEALSVRIVCDSSRTKAIKTLRVSTGDFVSTCAGAGEWRFAGKTPLGWNATLRGVLVHEDDNAGDNAYEEDQAQSHISPSQSLDEYVPKKTKSKKHNSNSGDPVVAKTKKKKSKKAATALLVDNDNNSSGDSISSPLQTSAKKPSPSAAAPVDNSIFPTHLSVSYKAIGQVPSGLKVQALKIRNARRSADGVKPFKGVRYITLTGDYIVR